MEFRSKKIDYVEHYQELVRKYFADTTEEGRIDKYARIAEAEYVLIHVFGMNEEAIHTLYQLQYSACYGA